MARWAQEESSDGEEEETKRVVKKATDKRFDALKAKIKEMTNHQKINDFGLITGDYEAIFKMVEKMLKLKSEDGPPNMFIRAIVQAENHAESLHEELKEKGEKLPKNKQTAFNSLRSKIKKGNRDYQELVDKCKENKDDFQDSDQGEADDDESSSSESEAGAQGSSSDSSSDSSDSSSESDGDSDSDSSDSSGSSGSSKSSKSSNGNSSKPKSDSEDEDGDENAAREKLMLKWVVTPEKQEKDRIKQEKQNKIDEAKKKRDDDKKQKNASKKKPNQDKGQVEQATGEQKEKEVTPEELKKKITDIAQQRGRRGFDRKVYMDRLTALKVHAVKNGPRAQLHILSSLVSADFDNTGHLFEAMRIERWNDAIVKVLDMLPLVIESEKLGGDVEKTDDKEGDEGDDDDEDPWRHDRLQNLFVSYVEMLDDELYKALQFTTDVYGSEYQEILGNNSKFLKLLKSTLNFFEDTNQTQALGSIAMRLMEHLHHNSDLLNRSVFESIQYRVPEDEKENWVWPADSKAYLATLSRYVHQRKAVSTDNPSAENTVDLK